MKLRIDQRSLHQTLSAFAGSDVVEAELHKGELIQFDPPHHRESTFTRRDCTFLQHPTNNHVSGALRHVEKARSHVALNAVIKKLRRYGLIDIIINERPHRRSVQTTITKITLVYSVSFKKLLGLE